VSEQKQTVQTQFGANAESYARSAVFAQSESLTEMIQVVHPQPGWEMLDVATGGGHCAFAFAPLVKRVIATDITEPMLRAAERVAQERGLRNIQFEQADVEALHYPDAHFDLVTCRIAAHHFGDPGQAVREMSRVCKLGGIVAVIDGIAPSERAAADEINAWEIARDPSHVALLTINGWSSLFCAANLDNVHLSKHLMALDFDDHMRRAGVTAQTAEQLRTRLLSGSQGMQDWLKPRQVDGRLTFDWPLLVIVGRKGE
jgi:ubiquinone/menaquinone biosynthesis C-methylase UbiE